MLCNCTRLLLQKVLAKQEAQMNLMKQAVEVRGQGSEGREDRSAGGSFVAHPPLTCLELGPADFTDVCPARYLRPDL